MTNKTLLPQDFKNKKIFIATPCYGGMATTHFITSLCSLVAYFKIYEIEYHIGLIGNESLITRARNTLTAQFMAKEFTHLMFIDADVSFQSEDVIRMLHEDRDILCGAYPLKGIPTTSVVHVKSLVMEDEKFLEARNAGTGFMMIKREVIKKMFESYPELRYSLNQQTLEKSSVKSDLKKYTYALFDTNIEEMEDGSLSYLSEDYLFCRRWQKIGGKVLLDPEIRLDHVGAYVFKGEALEIKSLDKEIRIEYDKL